MKLSSLFVAGLIVVTPLCAEARPVLTDGDLEIAQRLQNAFVKVADHASESVVVISAKQTRSARADAESDEEAWERFRGTPFEEFFRFHQFRVPPPRDRDSRGSGVIIRRDGYILTNSHVVEDADEIKVRLKDGREFDAKRIGTDRRTDVAVIKIEGDNLPVARLGDSDSLKVGQWAIAIGAPFELDYSFTVGFISAKGRPPMDPLTVANIDYIQTDAAINPGNSGGPLCDIEGRVIGINTLIRGLNRGIGFAIPINLARDAAEQLIDTGRVIRPWLGIGIEPLGEDNVLSDTVKEGVVVRQIEPDTPAARSDLKQADIIVAVDGVKVKSPRELQLQILSKKVGQRVTLDVVRAGKPMKVAIQTGEMADRLVAASRRSDTPSRRQATFGLTVQTLTKELARRLDVEHTEGVLVTDVASGSPAEQAGLARGDVITEVDRTPVRDTDSFAKALTSADTKKGVLVFVKRDGASTFVVLKEK